MFAISKIVPQKTFHVSILLSIQMAQLERSELVQENVMLHCESTWERTNLWLIIKEAARVELTNAVRTRI